MQSTARPNRKCRIACGAEDYAGKPERGRAEKEQLHEQEVRQEEENRQSSR